MRPEIEELKKLGAGIINKGRFRNIRESHQKAHELFGHLEPKLGDAAGDFEAAQSDMEEALSELESACDELEAAEDKEEREDGIEQIKYALERTVSSFQSVMEVAVVGAINHLAIQKELLEAEAKENEAKVKEIMSVPLTERGVLLKAWLASATTPELRQRRWKAVESIVSALNNRAN